MTQTRSSFSLTIFAILAAQSLAQKSYQPTNQEKALTAHLDSFARFIKQNKLPQAQDELSKAEALGDQYSCLEQKSHLFLLQGSQFEAYKALKLYFEGNPADGSRRAVGGAERMRAWYWWLTAKFGGSAKAKAIKDAWFGQYPLRLPFKGKNADPRSYSKNDLCQAYIWMANQAMLQAHYLAATTYFSLAKRADPSFTIPKEYADGLKAFPFNFEAQRAIEQKDYVYPAFNTFDMSLASIGSSMKVADPTKKAQM